MQTVGSKAKIGDRAYDFVKDFMKSGINRAYRTEKSPKGVRVMENVRYIVDENDTNDAHLMDIMYPENNKSLERSGLLPIIVNIHGGGFSMNSKDKLYRYYAMRLAQSGFAVVNINFRLSIEAKYPAQLEDTLSVLNFLEKYHLAYGLDVNRLFLVGDSSGAYMAAMTECILQSPVLRKQYRVKTSLKITGLGLNCGMFDFDTFLGKDIFFPAKKDIVMLLFGSRNFVMRPIYQFTSVFQYANESFCPAYIMDTGFRSFAPEAKRLRFILRQNKVPYQIRLYAGKKKLPHAFHIMNRYEESRETRTEMINFFKSLLR